MFQRTNVEGYQKDPETNVIVNTNDQELMTYKHNVAKAKQSKAICDDIESLKRQLIELRHLLQEHINGKHNV